MNLRGSLLYISILFIAFSLSLTSNEVAATDQYKVGISDVLDIRVLGHTELQGQFAVTSDGTITFPYIGTVKVKDKDITEIKEEITKKLSEGYIKYPVVSVSLMRSGKKIITFGELNLRGEIPFQDNMTVMTALSLAGGVTEEGLHGKLKVRRKQAGAPGGYRDIAESELDNGAIVNKDIEGTLLKTDDILIVEKNRTALIQGEVIKRGRFPLEKDMTVLRALLQAGGVTADSLYGKIKVRRKQTGSPGGYKDIMEAQLSEGVILNKEVEDMLLKPDDILIVEKNKTFLIQGEVANRGRFTLEKNMTVVRALLQAGGITENGLYGKVRVRRKHIEGSEEYADLVEAQLDFGAIVNKDVEDILLKPDDILIVEKNKTFLIQGEVASRGRFTLEKDMSVVRALLQAGGVTENGLYGTIKVRRKQDGEENRGYKDLMDAKLSNGIIENSVLEDTLLEPDDILLVERNKTYFIYGEANKTGEFVLQSDTTVFMALTIAGGFTKWGSSSKVKVLRLNKDKSEFETFKVDIDKVIKGDASADIHLQSGDIIIISSGVF